MRKVQRIPRELVCAVQCVTCGCLLVNSSEGYWLCPAHHTKMIPEQMLLDEISKIRRTAKDRVAVNGIEPQTVLELARRGFVDEDDDRSCLRPC